MLLTFAPNPTTVCTSPDALSVDRFSPSPN